MDTKKIFPHKTTFKKNKRKHSLWKAFMFLCSFLYGCFFSQQYPVRLIPIVTPPYGTKMSAFANPAQNNIQLQILMTDLQEPQHQLGIKLFLQAGLNETPIAQSNEFILSQKPLLLTSGANITLTNPQIAPLFLLQNLSGINPEQYAKPLPEGLYQMCFQAFDFYTKNILSQKTCANFFINQYQPPSLTLPQNKEKIQANTSNPIIFQWQPQQVAPNTKYIFTLKEIWDTQQNPISAFLSSRILWQEKTFAPLLTYGNDKTQLIPGKRYAWQVQAKSSSPLDHNSDNGQYKNNGLSEIFFFDYVENCPTPSLLIAKNAGRGRVEIRWSITNNSKGQYLIQYRKKGSAAQWNSIEAYQNSAFIARLEDQTEYEYRVGTVCGQNQAFAQDQTSDNAYAFSPVQFFTTDSQEQQNSDFQCGIMPTVDISNKNPLQGSLGTNDTFFAGDFPVTVITADGQNGVYSGTGYIVVPYLADTKIAVNFNNIAINSDKKLISGVIETSYDSSEKNVVEATAFLNDEFIKIEKIIDKGVESGELTQQEYDELNENNIDFTEKITNEINILEKENFISKEEVEEYKILLQEAEDALNGIECSINTENTNQNTSENESSYGKSFYENNDFILYIKDDDCKDKLKKYKQLLEKVKQKVGEKVASYKALKDFWNFIEKCGKDYRTQEEGYIPSCIWDHNNYAPNGFFTPYLFDPAFASGFVDGIIETGVGVVKLIEFSKCLDLTNPLFYTENCKKIRNNAVDTISLLTKTLLDEKERNTLFNNISDSFSAYIDETVSISNQARYNQGKIVLGAIGLAVGATEAKIPAKIASIISKIKKLPKSKITNALKKAGVRVGKKIKNNYTPTKFNGVTDFQNAIKKYPKELENAKKLTTQQLEKGIKSHQKQIQKHIEYLNDPIKRKQHVPNWDELSQQHKENLIHHWKKDIERHKDYMEIKKVVLYEKTKI